MNENSGYGARLLNAMLTVCVGRPLTAGPTSTLRREDHTRILHSHLSRMLLHVLRPAHVLRSLSIYTRPVSQQPCTLYTLDENTHTEFWNERLLNDRRIDHDRLYRNRVSNRDPNTLLYETNRPLPRRRRRRARKDTGRTSLFSRLQIAFITYPFF